MESKETTYDVSVIIPTYNSDMKKLRRTINSVICQEGCSFEIIITDDGSKAFDTVRVESILSKSGKKYLIISNKENYGTVKNIYEALKRATGKYVYSLGPGDMIYDSQVLCDFVKHCEKNKIEVCFGNPVYFRLIDTNPSLLDFSKPEKPSMYNNFTCRLSMLTSNSICGVSFFRKRELFTKQLAEILPCCRLVEDYSTTLLSLAHGIGVIYYNRNIAFYEYGEGVSTNWNSPYGKIAKEDCTNAVVHLSMMFPKDKLLSSRKLQLEIGNRKEYIKYICSHRPYIAFLLLVTQFFPHRKVKYTCIDTERLNKLFYFEE